MEEFVVDKGLSRQSDTQSSSYLTAVIVTVVNSVVGGQNGMIEFIVLLSC